MNRNVRMIACRQWGDSRVWEQIISSNRHSWNENTLCYCWQDHRKSAFLRFLDNQLFQLNCNLKENSLNSDLCFMRPNWNPRRLPIRNIRRGVKFQNKNSLTRLLYVHVHSTEWGDLTVATLLWLYWWLLRQFAFLAVFGQSCKLDCHTNAQGLYHVNIGLFLVTMA